MATLPFISSEELTRFVLFSNWIRSSDLTVKPDAFIPYPYPDLSVTRHKNLTQKELWRTGQDIADVRPATLHGRADISVGEIQRQSLEIVPRPVTNNPNHVAIVDWPADKPTQKTIAQQLAANAKFIPKP